MKPVTRVERRDAGHWMREGKNDARQTDGGGEAFRDSARKGCTSRREPGRSGASLPLAVDRIINLDRPHVGSTGNRCERRRLVLSDRQGLLPEEPLVLVGEIREE